ncbi:MAG: hypothetical protein A3K18_30280 [Lentisphaerae bacterium RIFOXYA12_64_32]|nr:MAG: hypothetical protein A3K18_30280 [Lentisphaerae bacterium RIFOXYA12_64_32]
MRKRWAVAVGTWVFVAAVFAVSWRADAVDDAGLGATPQLLQNTGLEQGTGDVSAGWGVWPPAGKEAGVSSTRDATVKHAGEFSGRLRIEREDFKGIATWHHPVVAVQAGQELVLSFWMKADRLAGHSGCDVQFRQGETQIVGHSAPESAKGSFDWRQVVHHFTVPAGVDHVCVVPLLEGRGTAWFDDVQLFGTPTAQPVRASAPPSIDGELTDACWQDGSGVSGFALASGAGLPERGTTVRVAYDADNLYAAFRCEKKPGDVLKATVNRRDGDVWTDDEVEVFLNPCGDRTDYYQFCVNALGAKYDSHRTDREWNADWRAAAKDGVDAWTVELAIPIAQLPLDLSVGANWCANFGRSDKLADQASAWSSTFGGFHTPGRFGTLTDLRLNLVPFYLKDAGARLAALRQAYESATAGLDATTAPTAIAAPFLDREPKVKTAIAELENGLRNAATLTTEDWSRIAPRAMSAATDIRNLTAASVRLRAFCTWRNATTPQPKFGLATAPAMIKVRKDGDEFGGQVARELALSAARNEYEGGQVIAVSLADADIPDCRADISVLSGPGGAVIGQEYLTLSIVGYIKTAKPQYPVSYVGDWPDPLMPNTPFTLKAGELQPVWLRVHVPSGTPAGDYRGTLTVSGGGEARQMAVLLHVFDFELPRSQHLATPFGCDPGSLSQWYTGSSDYEANLSPDVFTRWNRFHLDYRLTPTRVGRSYVKEVRDGSGKIRYDYSVMDACMEAVVDRLPPDGVAMAAIGNVGWAGNRGATCVPCAEDAHGGRRSGRIAWPKTESWAALDHTMAGSLMADRQCKAFRFWVRALDPALAGETIVAYVNAFPNRWQTTFPIGGAEWHEVRLPIEQYRHNSTGEPLTLTGLKTSDDFQFVIANKDRVVEYLIDDIVAECDGGDVVIDDFELETALASVREQMGAHLQHWRDKGWFHLGHVYAKDELKPDEYDQLLPSYRQAIDVAPDTPLMQTYYMNRTPNELVGPVKIWCATTAVYDEAFHHARLQAGEKSWLYVCCGPTPPYANFFIDQPGVDHRVLFWQVWQRQSTGLLYWRTNYWNGMMPLKADEPHWPDVPWDQEKVATYREFKVNGDGFLVYPGPDWTPLSSVRLENVRDGIEDYEYLCLLRERHPDSALLKVGDDISRDFTHFCKHPSVIEQRRLAIAHAIEGRALPSGSVTTGDGLALDFGADGGSVRMLLKGAPLPALPGGGGFYVAEATQGGAELIRNCSLEDDTDSNGGPDGFAAGPEWTRDNTQAHTGQWSMRCDIPGTEDKTSADLAVTVPAVGGKTYLVSFWLKCKGRGGQCPASIGYIQQQDDAGQRTTTVFQHNMAGGVSGDRDWARNELLLTTEQATRKLLVRTNIYRGCGTLWADDFSVMELDMEARPLFAKVSAASGDGVVVQGVDAARALQVDARWEPAGDMLRLSGTVSDTSGKDRCIVLSFRLPLNAIGGVWGNDVASPVKIPPTGRLARVEPWGSYGPFSVYPFSSVVLPDNSAGISLGVPMDVAQPFRLAYAGDQGVIVEWVVALTPLTAKFPQSAKFAAVLYTHDPAWGFRAAADKYYRLFPDSFTVRCPKQGNWSYIGDPGTFLGALPNPEDFGLRFNEFNQVLPPTGVEECRRRGYLNFGYTEPWGWWGWAVGLKPKEDESAAPKADVLRHIQKLAATCPPDVDRRKQTPALAAQTIVNSGMFDAAGEYTTAGYHASWGGYNWALNPAPDAVPKSQFGRFEATYLWEIERRLGEGADGIYLDSIVNSWTSVPNYRHEHLQCSNCPLTFSPLERRPVQLGVWNQYEFVAFLSKDLHNRGKLLMANIFPYNWVFFNHWLDVMGHETGWSMESAEKMRAERTLAYHKPYTWLLVLKPEVTTEARETWMRQGMSYGILPNIVGGTRDPKEYERFRPLYRKYMPTIIAMAEAGWEPITQARSDAPTVCVERFGPKDGKVYFSFRNDGDKPASAHIAVDWTGLGLKPAVSAIRQPEGETVTPDARGLVTVDLQPNGVIVLQFDAVAR